MSSTALPPLSPSEPPRVFGAPTLHTDGDLLAIGIAADRVLWSVEEPGELRGWSLATRRLVASRPLEGAATIWAFNWAARLLGSASDEVAVWEVSTGEQLASWSTPAWITSLAFQPGAAILATGHDDGAVRVWDWSEQRLLCELDGHRRPISAVVFSHDQKLLASAGEDKVIHVWDLQTGNKLGSLTGHKDRIPTLAWHPDNRRLFSAGWDTTVRVWDVTTFEPIILLNSHATQVHAIALSADGKLLASADSRNDVHVWDTDLHETMHVLREPTGEVRCLTFTPDDGKGNLSAPLLAWGGADRNIHLWDSRQGTTSATGVDPLVSRTRIAVAPDGKRLYSLGGGTDLRIWETESGQPVGSLEGDRPLRTFALSPDAQVVAAVGLDRDDVPEDRATLALYDAGSGKRLMVCDGQKGPITTVAFSPDGKILASGGVRSSDVWLWKVPQAEPLLLVTDAVDDCSVESLAFQPGGRLLAVAGIDYLATSGQDGQVVLWNLDTRRVERSLRVVIRSPHGGDLTVACGATALAFQPDGKVLACAGQRLLIRLWNLAEDRVTAELRGHTDTIGGLAYSPDGRWLASGSDDHTVRLWDARTGAQVVAWELSTAIKAVTFGPDGKWLFTGNGNTSCYQIEVDRLLADV